MGFQFNQPKLLAKNYIRIIKYQVIVMDINVTMIIFGLMMFLVEGTNNDCMIVHIQHMVSIIVILLQNVLNYSAQVEGHNVYLEGLILFKELNFVEKQKQFLFQQLKRQPYLPKQFQQLQLQDQDLNK